MLANSKSVSHAEPLSFVFSELKKISDWTPWVRKNMTRDGIVEERYRYVCRANVADARNIRIGGIRTASRLCPPHGCQSGEEAELEQEMGGANYDDDEIDADEMPRKKLRNMCVNAGFVQDAGFVANGVHKEDKGEELDKKEAGLSKGEELNSKEDGFIDPWNDSNSSSVKNKSKDISKNAENEVIPWGSKENSSVETSKEKDNVGLGFKNVGIAVRQMGRYGRRMGRMNGFCGCRDLGVFRMCRKCGFGVTKP